MAERRHRRIEIDLRLVFEDATLAEAFDSAFALAAFQAGRNQGGTFQSTSPDDAYVLDADYQGREGVRG